MKRLLAWCFGMAFIVGLPAALPAQGADYPERPVTIIVPFAPGGGTDILTRLLAEELRKELKQPFVVESRPGAATQIAAGAVANAAPDGYTLLMASGTTLATNPSIYKTLPYDPVKSFAPVALVGSAYFVLVANPDLPVKTLPELIAYIKSKPPGSMSYATSGAGTPHHMFMELFMKMTGTKLQHVPYRGSLPAATDVVSGVIPVMFVDLAPTQELVKAGKLRVFGLTTSERIKTAPEIPTISEAGLPGFVAQGWFAIVAPAGTPRPIVDRLNGVLTAAIKRPDVQDRYYSLGLQPLTSTPDELAAFIPAEIEKWGKLIRDVGITAER